MKVTSNYPVIVAKLRQLAPALRGPVERGLMRGLEQVSRTSQNRYLSGPRPQRLGVVTTRLRQSIAIKTRDDGTNIVGRVGSNVAYAAFHEFGFKGSVPVAAHTRVTSVSNVRGIIRGAELRMLRGPIQDQAGNVVGYKRSLKSALGKSKVRSVGIAFVKAHTRRMDYAGRPFIRPALERERDLIVREIERGLTGIVKAENQ